MKSPRIEMIQTDKARNSKDTEKNSILLNPHPLVMNSRVGRKKYDLPKSQRGIDWKTMRSGRLRIPDMFLIDVYIYIYIFIYIYIYMI